MASWGRERSRSPHRGDQRGAGAPPLAFFLAEHGLIDERSLECLKRAPPGQAEEVLLSLGPDVRNPSAFITRRLSPRPDAAAEAPFNQPPQQQHQPYQAHQQHQQHAFQSGGPGARMQAWAAPFNQSAPQGDVLVVHCNGAPRQLLWHTQAEAVAELVAWGVLDEGSADFLQKASEPQAKEIVAALGPDVRNPSAFVTKKLRELRAAEGGQAGQAQAAQAGGGGPWRRGPEPAYEQISIHHGGVVLQLPWVSKERAAEQLLSWGVLDEGSADFLAKAPEYEAKQVVSALGPDVRNPSAFVTRKLKGLLGGAASAASAAPSVETIPFHHNGTLHSLQWFSKEQALTELVRCGVLDEVSADFLLKAPDQEAKDIIASLGPDVRNPSAFVTRKMKGLRGGGAPAESQRGPQRSFPTVVVHTGNGSIPIEWASTQQAASQLVGLGVLDEGSADFLQKVPEATAMEIIAGLGPDVRNPSALVTRKVKAALQGGDTGGRTGDPPVYGSRGGGYAGGAMEDPNELQVYHNGSRIPIQWRSQPHALEQLVARGILDQRSADFLAKLPERAARDIVASLGPDVRNPSAYVTKEAKKWQA